VKRVFSITDLARLYIKSLEEAGEKVSMAEDVPRREASIFLVHRAMTNQTRHYHDLAHLFQVARGLPPLGRLAAIYHDTIYFQIDGGFPPGVVELMHDVVESNERGIFLTQTPDKLLRDVMSIFGMTPGQELSPAKGINEFLSAVLAVRELRDDLETKALWTIAACIEGTIPFRHPIDGISAQDGLAMRLATLHNHDSTLSSSEIERIVKLTAMMANADVASFGKDELGPFIENTWQLLPETNAECYSMTCSIQDYREALQRMKSFLSQLDPDLIFRRYHDEPEDFEAMLDNARKNLLGANDYLRAHIVALALLQALAQATGGDGPISYFTGLTESSHSKFQRLIEKSPHSLHGSETYRNEQVAQALCGKHSTSTRFDHGLSPLAAFFYETLDAAELHQLECRIPMNQSDASSWRQFLSTVPPRIVREVALVLCETAYVRRHALASLIAHASS